MKVIKSYIPVEVDFPDHEYLSINYARLHTDSEYPESFDTEEEAIEYAFNKSPFARWAIVPVVSFDNFADI